MNQALMLEIAVGTLRLHPELRLDKPVDQSVRVVAYGGSKG